jgi:hypothetical protein
MYFARIREPERSSRKSKRELGAKRLTSYAHILSGGDAQGIGGVR